MGSCNKLEIKYEDFQVPHVKIFTLGTIYTMVELRFETPNLSVFGYTGNVFSWSSCGALSLSEANLHFCSAPKIWFSMVCSQIHWTTRKVPSVLSLIGSLIWPHFPLFFFVVHCACSCRFEKKPTSSTVRCQALGFYNELINKQGFFALDFTSCWDCAFRISKQKELCLR